MSVPQALWKLTWNIMQADIYLGDTVHWISKKMRKNFITSTLKKLVLLSWKNSWLLLRKKKKKKTHPVRTMMEDPLQSSCKRHSADLPAILNLCICNAWCNMLMWCLASCGQTGPDLEAKARWSQQIAWTGLCCVSPGLWMTGSLQGWQVIIHSPGIPHPSLDTTQPAGKRVGVSGGGEGHNLGVHILLARHLAPFFLISILRNKAFIGCPVATGNQPLSKWNMRCHRSVPLSGAGPNKVPYVADEELRLTVASWSKTLHRPILQTTAVAQYKPGAGGLRHFRQITVVQVPQQ